MGERLGTRHYAEWAVRVRGVGESTLAPLLRRVVRAHPQVYVKSRAPYRDPASGITPLVRVTLSLAGDLAAEQAEWQGQSSVVSS